MAKGYRIYCCDICGFRTLDAKDTSFWVPEGSSERWHCQRLVRTEDVPSQETYQELQTQMADLKEHLAGVTHHHLSTVAGILRLHGARLGPLPEDKCTKLGDRLAETAQELRDAAGFWTPGDSARREAEPV